MLTAVLFASKASALPVLEVGSVDSLVAWTTIGSSGDGAEAAFIAKYLGLDADDIAFEKAKGSGDDGWEQVDGTTKLFSFDFTSAGIYEPSYYLVKTGSGVQYQGASYTHFLFQNLGSLEYAVIDLGLFTASRGKIEIDKVSHVSTAGGRTKVPEPGSLSLMLLGLASVAFGRRAAAV
jgi:hypothetical protein